MKLTSKRIEQARAAVDAAVEKAKQVQLYTVLNCAHKKLGQAPYRNTKYSNADPPCRVCLRCGLVEDSWGCGHIILTAKEVIDITRDDVFTMRTFWIQDDHKGPLLREEITLEDLIRRLAK